MSNFENIFNKITNTITPEYLKQLAQDCYNEDRTYPENFSNWYSCIKNFGNFSHANIIANQVLSFEELQLLQKYESYNEVNWDEIYNIFKPTLEKMEFHTLYNIKNGCFSNKFDFSTCITNKMDLPKQFWKINYQSSLFETGGETEIVVRELIPYDIDRILTIYNGMPLRTEVRAFYNMDSKKLEYLVDYWDYDYCRNNLNNLNDKLIFDIFHNKIDSIEVTNHNREYIKVCNYIIDNIQELEIEGLKGIWSIDFLYDNNTNKVYLIDMARVERSAYWDPKKVNKNE